MISVQLSTATLSVSGHREGDRRVCAAVSALTAGLHEAFGAPIPAPGDFTVELSLIPPDVVTYLAATFLMLARLYPADLEFDHAG